MTVTTLDTMEDRIAELDREGGRIYQLKDGRVAVVVQDLDPGAANPRDNDNLGVMLCWHRGYILGDDTRNHEHPLKREVGEALERGGIRLAERYLRIVHGATQVIPLGLLDHSGLHMYAGGGSSPFDPGGWDSGPVGLIFDTAETREECGTQLEHVREALLGEVKVYDQCLQGEVYGVIELTPTGPIVETDIDGDTTLGIAYEEDSCWGYLGYDSLPELVEAEYGEVA